MRLLLHGLQSPINLGSILRVAETFATPVLIWDPHALLDDPAKRQTVADFSCGAFARNAWRRLASAPDPAADRAHRHVATCLRESAVALPDFDFDSRDLVAIGNEYDGLPASYIEAAPARLTIPMPDVWTPKLASSDPIDPTHPLADPANGSPVLSAPMSAGIICYAAFARRRLRPHLR